MSLFSEWTLYLVRQNVHVGFNDNPPLSTFVEVTSYHNEEIHTVQSMGFQIQRKIPEWFCAEGQSSRLGSYGMGWV